MPKGLKDMAPADVARLLTRTDRQFQRGHISKRDHTYIVKRLGEIHQRIEEMVETTGA